jgi:uncharacterized membrane protein
MNTCIQTAMQIEQVKPNRPSFKLVVALFAVALLVIFIAAVIIISWRSHGKHKPPFVRHPVAQLSNQSVRRFIA